MAHITDCDQKIAKKSRSQSVHGQQFEKWWNKYFQSRSKVQQWVEHYFQTGWRIDFFLHDIGGYRDPEVLDDQVLEKSLQTIAKDHEFTLRSMRNLADANKTLGNLNGAVKLHETVLKEYKKNGREDNPISIIDMAELVHMYRLLGRSKMVPVSLQKVDRSGSLKSQPNFWGRSMRYSFLQETPWKESLWQIGRGSEKILAQVLKSIRERFREDHPFTSACMVELAIAYVDGGMGGNGLATLEQGVKSFAYSWEMITVKQSR